MSDYLVPLSNGGVAVIDDVDSDKVKHRTWRLSRDGYAMAMMRVGERKYRITALHRVIMGCSYRDGKIVDHRNFNTLDCRRSNLRIATKQQNQIHQKGHSGAVSSFKGVSHISSGRSWRARLCHRHLGCYATEAEAAKSYDRAAKEQYGAFAFLNFAEES